ncbi:hypothetical protein DL93DRAFT_2059552, partial [Clavulina sp. PMI_390]
AILEVFIMCLAGWFLARQGILDKKTQKQLNHVNVSLFTPSLLFSKVAFSLSPDKIRELWVIPVSFAVVTAVSGFVAYWLGKLLRLHRSQRSFAMAASMFNNSNSLPIALMQSLVVTVPQLKWKNSDDTDTMIARALGYLVVYSTLGMVLRWSYGVRLLQQADEDEPTIDVNYKNSASYRFSSLDPIVSSYIDTSTLFTRNHTHTQYGSTSDRFLPPTSKAQSYNAPSALGSSSTLCSPLSSSPPWSPMPSPGVVSTHLSSDSTTPPHRLSGTLSPSRPESIVTLNHGAPPQTSMGLDDLSTQLIAFWRGFTQFMTMPMYAAFASIFVVLTPPLQNFLSEDVQPVKGFLISAGNCSIPITLVVLGAYFHREHLVVETSQPQFGSNLTGPMQPSPSDITPSPSTEQLEFKGPDLEAQRHPKGSPSLLTVTIFVAVVSRMIITPMIIVPFLPVLTNLRVDPAFDDPIFICSMILLISAPPALTLAQITQAACGDAFERLLSRTIFWSYCVFTPPLTLLYVMIALYLMQGQS